jgi:hypothetical protein
MNWVKKQNQKYRQGIFRNKNSVLLVNIWVNLLWLKISRKRRGGRLIYRQLFGFKQMLAFLCQVVERKYQVVEGVYLPPD